MSNIPSLTLNTNASMPLLGLGVYKATAPGEVEGAIATALDLGYRLIDTASAYKNEEGVGRGIRSSSVPRKELFITTKYGILHSGSEILTGPFNEVWIDSDLIMWIFI